MEEGREIRLGKGRKNKEERHKRKREGRRTVRDGERLLIVLPRRLTEKGHFRRKIHPNNYSQNTAFTNSMDKKEDFAGQFFNLCSVTCRAVLLRFFVLER